ncbi:cupin domain-containing protein [Paraburkholderia flagellata]|uniref:cupin domain-containing protein n=1 Tax=Paraburkholderia flagellata TaxID=2883241 RepID=UPI001F3EAA09|nr:cupin domain-containing protein [Paraburkholderia flagellata]
MKMLNVAHIVDLMKDEGEVTQYRLPRGLLLAGNPVQTLKHRYISPCGQFSSGLWESTCGLWTVEYEESEYCEMLSGVCLVRDAQGGEKVLRTGDRFVIPHGFRGTWEVVEACQKIFVSYAPQAKQAEA